MHARVSVCHQLPVTFMTGSRPYRCFMPDRTASNMVFLAKSLTTLPRNPNQLLSDRQKENTRYEATKQTGTTFVCHHVGFRVETGSRFTMNSGLQFIHTLLPPSQGLNVDRITAGMRRFSSEVQWLWSDVSLVSRIDITNPRMGRSRFGPWMPSRPRAQICYGDYAHLPYIKVCFAPCGSSSDSSLPPTTFLLPVVTKPPLMTVSNTVFTVFSGIGLTLSVIPLWWHLGSRNVGTCMFAVWTALACLVYFVNSIVWNGNTINRAPVWCDICTSR
jgi:hypothetical protein